jgi:hypothetical protein
MLPDAYSNMSDGPVDGMWLIRDRPENQALTGSDDIPPDPSSKLLRFIIFCRRIVEVTGYVAFGSP